jgi:hypothetical protein
MVQNLRRSLKLAFNKSEYVDHIDRLQNANVTFRLLLQTQRSSSLQLKAAHDNVKDRPRGSHRIQQASLKLHDIFLSRTMCADIHHSSHMVKLCLQTRIEDDSAYLELLLSPISDGWYVSRVYFNSAS